MARIFKVAVLSKNLYPTKFLNGIRLRRESIESQKTTSSISSYTKDGNVPRILGSFDEKSNFDEIDYIVTNIIETESGIRKKSRRGRSINGQRTKDRWLFFPQNYWKRVWDTLIFALVMILCVVEPFDLALSSTLRTNIASRVAEVFFMIDMLVVFNTLVISDAGHIIDDRLQIAKIYLKFWFWFDLIALMPSIVFRAVSIENFDRLSMGYIVLSLLRLVRITRVPRIINRFSQVIEINPNVISFVTRISVITIAFHWTACLYWLSSLFLSRHNAFYSLDDSELELFLPSKGNSSLYYYLQYWLPPRELIFFNSTQLGYSLKTNQYLWSLFFSIMVTTGSGRDIKPTTESEYIVSICCVFVGLIIFAYIVSGVTALLNSQEGEEALLRQSIFSVESFFNKHQSIPQSQRVRTKDWLLYRYSRSGVGSQRYNELLGDLPDSLALEIKMSLRKPIIDQLELFSSINNALCLIDIIDNLEMRLLLPGEVLYSKGGHPDGLYILVHGVLKQKQAEHALMKTLKAISMFGVEELVLQLARLSTVTAATHVETLKLSKNDYSAMTSKYPDFSNALTKIVCGKETTGWDKVRQIIKIARTSRFVGMEVTDMNQKFINTHQEFPFKVDSMSELYEGDGRAFQHFVYKKNRKLELDQMKRSMENVQDSGNGDDTAYRNPGVFEAKCKRRTIASKLASRSRGDSDVY